MVLAFDLGGTKLAAAVVTEAGHIAGRTAVPVEDRHPRAVIAQMNELASQLTASGTGPAQAAGVAVPGLVRRDGTVWAPNLGWERVAVGRTLSRRLGIPVAVDSDRNAAVLGEAWRGAARGRTDVIALVVGTGIGAGILSGGRLVRGAHELSGCAGWMVVGPWRRPADGRFGCLESLAAGPAIAESARRALSAREPSGLRRVLARRGPDGLTARDVAAAARGGDTLARRVFHEAGASLGHGVGNLVSLFDPEVIVFGGGLAEAADLWFDPMREAALATCQPIAARRVRFVVSRLGARENLLGAASIARSAPEAWSLKPEAVVSSP
jgi:glucokinase